MRISPEKRDHCCSRDETVNNLIKHCYRGVSLEQKRLPRKLCKHRT